MKRGASTPAEPPQKRTRVAAKTQNDVPTEALNLFVFGAGGMCELGLGPEVVEVKRPRLNPLTPAATVGLVTVSNGGAHSIAIDRDGQLWSWGQNDSGALGRDTALSGSDDEDDEDATLNPKESTPARVDVSALPRGVQFSAVGTTDNLSAAISTTGRVYAWGTFVDDSIKMFSSTVKYQKTPVLLDAPRGAVALAGGKDHLLVLDKKGYVYAWGVGTSSQLGQPMPSSLRTKVFGPFRVPKLKNIVSIAAGDYQSFAVDNDGKVWSWGLNNFAQTGHGDAAGDGALIEKPTVVDFPEPVKQVASGNHHSLFLTVSGDLYTIGETNFHQLGVEHDKLPASTVREKAGAPAYVPEFVKVTQGASDEERVDVPKFKFVAAGSDHSLALSATDGSAWTWGFGEVYQLGHGKPAGEDGPEDEPVPTRIKNTATTGVSMVYAGAGGQYSALAAVAEPTKTE